MDKCQNTSSKYHPVTHQNTLKNKMTRLDNFGPIHGNSKVSEFISPNKIPMDRNKSHSSLKPATVTNKKLARSNMVTSHFLVSPSTNLSHRSIQAVRRLSGPQRSLRQLQTRFKSRRSLSRKHTQK